MSLVMQMATLLPIQQMVINQDDRLPEGFDYVITHDNNFVVTNTGQNVIAKSP